MKHLSVVLILSVLVACGEKIPSKNNKIKTEERLNCLESTNTLCMPSTLWVIDPGSREIPKNIQLEIDGNTAFDSCREEGFLVSPDAEGRMLLSMKTHGAFKENQMITLKIIDKGEDCKDEKPIYDNKALKLNPENYHELEDFFVSQKVVVRLNN